MKRTPAQLNPTPATGYRPPAHYYAHAWCLLLSISAFAAYVAWDLNAFQLVLSLDRSYMASLIMALVILASLHCGWHTVQNSRRIELAHRQLLAHKGSAIQPSGFINEYIGDLLFEQNESGHTADDAIVEIHADRLRGAVDLGWFLVDLSVRMGLLGTIIGFMLIFASLSGLNIEGGDDLTKLLIAMSGGMGTALLTTLTGLIGASLLGFQYLILGREVEHLVGLLMRIKNQQQSPVRSSV